MGKITLANHFANSGAGQAGLIQTFWHKTSRWHELLAK
jgi:hypothetical protein